MKVNQDQGRSHPVKSKSPYLNKNKIRVSGVIMVVGLIGLVIISGMIFGYGAYLQKIGQSKYLKQTLLRVAKLDFSFIKNYSSGQLQELDEIQMDIKFKHLSKIQYLREQALKDGLIAPEIKNEEFPATLTWNGKTQDVKISLTGLMAETHLSHPSQWSFEVKVRGDNTFKGMKRFGLLRPSTRGYMTDWIGFEIMKKRGLIGLRVDYVHLSVNGKPIGIYYLEERFDKHLIENNQLREGILFKLDDEFSPYQESKLMNNPDTRAQLLMLKGMWHDVMAGDLSPSQFFDMKKMAQLFAICDLMNNKHPLSRQNIRFYFNPVTSLAEPIAREWETLGDGEVSNLRLFIEKPIPLTRHAKFSKDPILRLIYDNLDFKKHYIQESEILCQSKFIDQFLSKNEDKISALMNKIYRTWPFYESPTYKLFENRDYMRSVLFPKDDQLIAHLVKQDRSYLQVSLENLRYLPIEVTHVSWRDSVIYRPEKFIIIDSKEKDQPYIIDIPLPASSSTKSIELKEIKIHYNIYGLENRKLNVGVLLPDSEMKYISSSKSPIEKPTYHTFDFILKSKDNLIISIPDGNWTIDRDLIVPAGRRFEISAGATINITNGVKILSYSPVFMIGNKNKPIRFFSVDNSGGSINVLHAGQQSQLSYVLFEYSTPLKVNDKRPNAALTFIESPVNIYQCAFLNANQASPYLNLQYSDFSLHQSCFKNLKGSALIIKHCEGRISNTSFINIRQDGIISANSTLNIQYPFFNDIGQHSFLAMDESQLSIRWANIILSKNGITATGQSDIRLFDTKLVNNEIGIELSDIPQSVSGTRMKIERTKISDTHTPFSIGENSNLMVDGVPYGERNEGVLDHLLQLVE